MNTHYLAFLVFRGLLRDVNPFDINPFTNTKIQFTMLHAANHCLDLYFLEEL